LTDHLLVFTASIDLQVLRGNKAIEIRKAGVNKGSAVQQWLAKHEYDFVLAIGDDLTDEDMFAVLPSWAYSFRVGTARTHARFRLQNSTEVLQLLAELAVGQDSTTTDSQGTARANPTSDIPQI
jgi:trehalose 6-phosphate synthase/phosphatase